MEHSSSAQSKMITLKHRKFIVWKRKKKGEKEAEQTE